MERLANANDQATITKYVFSYQKEKELGMNNRDDKPQLSFYRPEEHRWWKSPKKIGIGLGVVAVLGLSYYGYDKFNHYQIEQRVSANQKADSGKKHKVASHADKLANKDISFDQNTDIPDAATLQKYRSSSEKLSFNGYISVPKQNGVTVPITPLQINEGASNKVLAYGAGTVNPNQVMGQGRYTVAAHNVGYGGGKLMFSPMQKDSSIDVDKQPKVYLTDMKKIYVYQLNKKSDNPTGKQSISFRNNGKIADDSQVKDGVPEIAMVTCDEDGLVFNWHPEKRLIMIGKLIKTVDVRYATSSEKSLFPALAE